VKVTREMLDRQALGDRQVLGDLRVERERLVREAQEDRRELLDRLGNQDLKDPED
jgi:hypothetical protein